MLESSELSAHENKGILKIGDYEMKKLLIEGPVGHMWHPFDLDTVQDGKDLLSVFENEVVEYINNFTPSIKIDGINGPIRLITNENGDREFAIDRFLRKFRIKFNRPHLPFE